MLHSKKDTFINDGEEQEAGGVEKEADAYAQQVLIPRQHEAHLERCTQTKMLNVLQRQSASLRELLSAVCSTWVGGSARRATIYDGPSTGRQTYEPANAARHQLELAQLQSFSSYRDLARCSAMLTWSAMLTGMVRLRAFSQAGK